MRETPSRRLIEEMIRQRLSTPRPITLRVRLEDQRAIASSLVVLGAVESELRAVELIADLYAEFAQAQREVLDWR